MVTPLLDEFSSGIDSYLYKRFNLQLFIISNTMTSSLNHLKEVMLQ